MRTDLNVWMNDINETVRQVPFYFANNSSGIYEGQAIFPVQEIIGMDVVIGILILQSVVLIMILYYQWRRGRSL